MRAHMRRLMAAAVGVAGWAAAAVAQPIPVSMPATPVSATAPAAAPVVAPSPAALAVPASPVVISGNGGCAGGNCGGAVAGRHGGGLFSAIAIGGGTANPASCGCTASEKTFLFGSCRQFYNPTDTCGSGHGGGLFGKHGGLGCGGCVTPILGTGAAGTHGICCYGAYNLR